MQKQFKPYFAVALALLAASCAGNKDKNDAAADNAAAGADIRGRWNIERIALGDSASVVPAVEVPGVGQYISFEDGEYFIKTNCNSLSGSYTVSGDSIAMADGVMTEMACDNMATEDALRRILPTVVTMRAEDDSTLVLCGSNPSECIVLRKAAD